MKASGRFRRWHEVYVVLHANELHYYVDPMASGLPKRKILLAGCSVLEADAEDSKRPHAFKVTQQPTGDMLLFAAQDRAQLEFWVAAIRSVIGLAAVPEFRAKATQEGKLLFQELTALVTTVDQMAPLVGCEIESKQLSAFDKRPTDWGEELGSIALAIAGAAGVTSFKRSAAAVKQMSATLVMLLTKVDEMQRVLLGNREGDVVRDLTDASNSLFSLTADLVLRLGQDATLVEQMQAHTLTVQRVLPLSIAAATAKDVPGVTAHNAEIIKHVNSIRDCAVKLGDISGHDLPVFSAPAVVVLAAEFATLANDCVALNSAQVAGVLAQPAKALREACAKLLAVCMGATSVAPHTLGEALHSVELMIEDVAAIHVSESIRSLSSPAQAIVEQLWNLSREAAEFNAANFNEIRDALSQLADQIAWSTRAIAREISDVDARETFTRGANAIPHQLRQLVADIDAHVREKGRQQAIALKLACNSVQFADSLNELLRSAIAAQRHMQRKGTIFEEDLDGFPSAGGAGSDGAEDGAEYDGDLDGTGGGRQANTDGLDVLDEAAEQHSAGRPRRNQTVRSMRAGSMAVAGAAATAADDDYDPDDVDIWAEPPDNPMNIVIDAELGVKAANLNKLVERLTMVDNQDIVLQKTFITTYRSFTTPEKLFRKLRQRYAMKVPHLPPSVSREEYHKLFVMPVQLRIINVLKQWMEMSFFDFSDQLIEKIRTFINTDLVNDNHTTFSRQLNNLLAKQLEERQAEQREQQLEQERINAHDGSNAAKDSWRTSRRGLLPISVTGDPQQQQRGSPPQQQAPPGGSATTAPSGAQQQQLQPIQVRRTAGTRVVAPGIAAVAASFTVVPNQTDESVVPASALGIFAYHAEEIARQMTFVDFHYFRQIRPVELLNQSWSKKKELAPNVTMMIKRFNDVSLWVTSLILSQKTPDARVCVWVKLVEIGDALLRMNNFNTLLAFLSAFNKAAIFRLRMTKEALPASFRQWFDTQMKLMNPDGAYHHYRDALHTADPPCLPYLGVYLTDLTFIEDGNKDFLNGLINFRKRQLVYGIISEVQLYQQTHYDIVPDMNILQFLNALPFKPEEELFKVSLQRESRPSRAMQHSMPPRSAATLAAAASAATPTPAIPPSSTTVPLSAPPVLASLAATAPAKSISAKPPSAPSPGSVAPSFAATTAASSKQPALTIDL